MSTRIAVVGLWHLGEIYSACLAELGHWVTGVSHDAQLIANFQKNLPPLAEPRLAELLDKYQKQGTLSYTTDYAEISKCNVVWLTFDTPVNDQDEVDLSVVFEAIQDSLPHLAEGVTIGISSQLPVGTSKRIVEMIRSARPTLSFSYFYSPENLRLGDAVRGFLEPGRVVVGADTPVAMETASNILAPLKTNLIKMSTASAEMSKHAMNAWLAMSISFTNDIADVCEQMGADVEDVIRALKSEPRVGDKAFLFAGLGFSGGTLGRDLKALMHTAERQQLTLPVIESVYRKNASRNDVVPARLKKEWGEIAGKTIALLGVTYKAGTSTLRRSQPLEIDVALRALGAVTRLSDPLAIPHEVQAASPSPFFRDPYTAVEGADAALVLTPTREYRDLDFAKLAKNMKHRLLFDTCNILVPVEQEIVDAGLRYLRVGV